MLTPDCLRLAQERVLPLLERHLQEAPAAASRLLSAMSYANLEGGKRLRAALVYTAAQTFDAPLDHADAAAVAVEFVHAYSLIHDDLPAMDNSPLRRGLASCHIAYDEATAILAGDALQALAFEVLANDAQLPVAMRLNLVQRLAKASGVHGMAGGQMIDLLYTGGSEKPSLTQLQQMHHLKTGALLEASILMGCDCAGLTDAFAREAIATYGQALGLAYQIQDDILDVVSMEGNLGKPQGRDAELNKMTYPAVVGLGKACEMREALYQQGMAALKPIALDTTRLQDLLTFVVRREN
ncbi:MAG: (2E,6E)-farnesyl diphosphate synthase [Gammaproteobacteria bacterium]|jgi:farnesyl diphosphate synthase|nr:(2E,6E)-farnesyl diphosphate synthase [Gammaproteobacteria bacterium]